MQAQLIASCLEACKEAYHPRGGDFGLFFRSNVRGVWRSLWIDRQQYILIAVAGTNDFDDWLDNLRIIETSHGFHSGWWDAYQSIRKDLQTILNMYSPTAKILLTGHSAGGAISSIAGGVLSRFREVSLVTFACPRFCQSQNIKRLARCERVAIAHYLDPVPYLPLNFELLPIERQWWNGNPHKLPVAVR